MMTFIPLPFSLSAQILPVVHFNNGLGDGEARGLSRLLRYHACGMRLRGRSGQRDARRLQGSLPRRCLE